MNAFARNSLPAAVCLAAALSACTDPDGAGDGTEAGVAMSLEPPPFATRGFAIEGLQPTVAVGITPLTIVGDAPGGGVVGTARVPPAGENFGADLIIDVQWRAPFGNDGIRVASARKRIPPPTTNREIVLYEEEYEIERYDDDCDGVSNARELAEGTPPRPFAQGPCERDAVEAVDLFVRSTVTDDYRPVIDGIWQNPDGKEVWRRGASQNGYGNKGMLRLDRVFDNDGPVPEPDRPYNWRALHDGEFLYLRVQYARDLAILPRDAPSRYPGANGLSVYIDGDLSRSETFDPDSDRFYFFPVFDEEGSVFRPFAPDGTAVSDDLEVATVADLSRGESVWEIAIPLASVGVEVGRPFGFDIVVEENADGGARDARRAWNRPSYTGPNPNGQPARYGTALLVQ